VTQSQSQSYVTTDGQSASLLWYKAHIWGFGPDLYYSQTLESLLWSALSDERTGLSFASVAVSSNKSVVSKYNLHFTCYSMYVYTVYTRNLSVQAQYNRSYSIISSFCYNGSLVT
jgi:hypothetical protein